MVSSGNRRSNAGGKMKNVMKAITDETNDDLTDNEIRPDIGDVFTQPSSDPTSTAIPREEGKPKHTPSSASAPEIDPELVALQLELHTARAENQKAILLKRNASVDRN
ncbi:hypothetical protein SNE40_022887 [Patella caerulea]|uniref:Uncharacterized protein n=1 Tax=Patella caerulea TaxID=87958 RepID=A0AAN8FXH3_PATCE